MKRIYIILPLIALVAIGSALLFNKFVVAQDAGQGLTVSPPSQEVTVDPGGTVTVKAKLRNPSNTTLPIEVHIEDFTAKGDEGQVALTTAGEYSVVSWTKVSPSSFQLAPGETREVTAVIKAPIDAAGGRFGSFVFAVKTPENSGGGAGLSQEIASLFLVKVNGAVDEKLELTSFTARPFSEFGDVPFELTFKNSGNIHVKTFGLVNVTDMFGRKVEDIVVTGTNIFPNATRIIKPSLNKQFLIGKYTATALMYYGSANENITATTTFYVFPVRIAVITIVVLLVLFLMRKRLKKAMKALGGK